MKKAGDRRGEVFMSDAMISRLQRQRGLLDLAVPALASSARGNTRSELVNRKFHAAVNITRGSVLKTRPEELTRSNLWYTLYG